ncbi:hypothetical protein HMPREF6123_2510 [Oribacterium sinus F0268]|uniref:Uncharacterized protein n=1 Tax=Oribacterium sinus F0268 TaxID=585501 RepID=C2L191_9FIRM|nr:hypothetical protein HMPREF6123_2510 [Oribacterium sinus F0268]
MYLALFFGIFCILLFRDFSSLFFRKNRGRKWENSSILSCHFPENSVL